MVANKEAIVLDSTNNVFVGPDKQFKIVIDEFDGKTVKAWHVETEKAKTGNLAVRAQGKHIDLVVGQDCRSTVHFISRWYNTLYDEHLKGMQVFN
jgi:hypothetical protein